MKVSVLIVSKNRKEELKKTLEVLEKVVNLSVHEIRIYLDGSMDDYKEFQKLFPNIFWHGARETVGASKARNILFKKAKGEILIGFDDDAHPLQSDFIRRTISLFEQNDHLGIISYGEVRGVFINEELIETKNALQKEDFLASEFLGCGFAIKKNVYEKTRGFPVWVDIYGEEICLSLEVMNLDYAIMATQKIQVNHRVDKQKRKISGADYFRFKKQLKNITFFYLVYYPFPLLLKKILKLYYHNFIKYARRDKRFLRSYFDALYQVLLNSRKVLSYRTPVSIERINQINELPNPKF